MKQTELINPEKHSNSLIRESSPYLLQHAHNPVDWHAWNEETLAKAKREDKMLLISIGYSACHWCHVMEHESFENEGLATLMNENFVCIKVDREERPDVDAVYMTAVQLIHGNGGWPLNCFALPDGRPFYGGTYFQPAQWEELLKNIARLYKTRRPDIEAQAKQIMEGIEQENMIRSDAKASLSAAVLDEAYQNWLPRFDLENGGNKGAPKFPMPSNFSYLLKYYFKTQNAQLKDYLELSLDKMAKGGIYDQLGGGFSRYAVDAQWKIPHFEKMLYDNAQLISLYTEAFQVFGKQHYLDIACQSADFVLKELTSPEGMFYSALDADSEGVEGKFYVWTKDEFNTVLGHDSEIIAEYFEVDKKALWENGKNVLMRTWFADDFAREKGIDPEVFDAKLKVSVEKLLKHRNKRIRPGLDDKSLTSWNALMIKSLAHLSVISGNKLYEKAAFKAADYIHKKLNTKNGGIFHSYKNGKVSINGFLEDYALMADAALELFQLSMNQDWAFYAQKLTDYAISNFYDDTDGLFWFTDKNSHALVSRKKEIYDNVIPASNSAMAIVLLKLSKIFENRAYESMCETMSQQVSASVKMHPASHSNWASHIFYLTEKFYEVVVAGADAKSKWAALYKKYHPAKMVFATTKNSDLPIFRNRYSPEITMIFVCADHVCKEPVENVQQAFDQLH